MRTRSSSGTTDAARDTDGCSRRPPARGRRTRWSAAPAAVALVLAPVLAGCGSGGGASGGSPAAATPSASGAADGAGGTGTTGPGGTAPGSPGGRPSGGTTTVPVSVYFLRDGKVAPARRTTAAPGTLADAVRALLAGPTGAELRAGWATAIPSGTTLLGVSAHGTTATVDLSGRYASGGGSLSMSGRLAQVVYTATQFTSADRVAFRLDGKPVGVFGGEGIVLGHPVGRADFEELTPAVLIESPVAGDTVRSPVRVYGTANTFEAVFRLAVTDSAGRTAADVQVHATSGTGTRGTFDVRVPYRAGARTGPGTITAYYLSPRDGSRVVVFTVPVTLRP